jgi:hypothetical protein
MSRRGPKFELTQDLIVSNIRTVMARIGAETLSRRDYDEHGSFSSRAIVRKFGGWERVCELAGIPRARNGRPPKARRICTQCRKWPSTTVSPHCEVCVKRIRRQSRGQL